MQATEETTQEQDHFYEMWVNTNEGKTGYFVYYRSPTYLEPEDVPECAVVDGDLMDTHLEQVEYVLEITPDEYFEHMTE